MAPPLHGADATRNSALLDNPELLDAEPQGGRLHADRVPTMAANVLQLLSMGRTKASRSKR
jgi:hypothetical protein